LKNPALFGFPEQWHDRFGTGWCIAAATQFVVGSQRGVAPGRCALKWSDHLIYPLSECQARFFCKIRKRFESNFFTEEMQKWASTAAKLSLQIHDQDVNLLFIQPFSILSSNARSDEYPQFCLGQKGFLHFWNRYQNSNGARGNE
jgi:hypothetical protein